jgi:ABC-type multidrug transport system ATPase subunit
VILATHNMAEAESICDRVAIIDRGKVIATGTPDTLKRSLGAPPLVMEIQPPPKTLEVLSSLKGVRGYTSSIDEERGLATVQVVVDDEDAVVIAVRAMKESGYNVLTSWRRSATIEEVFVSLVGKGFKEREEQ